MSHELTCDVLSPLSRSATPCEFWGAKTAHFSCGLCCLVPVSLATPISASAQAALPTPPPAVATAERAHGRRGDPRDKAKCAPHSIRASGGVVVVVGSTFILFALVRASLGSFSSRVFLSRGTMEPPGLPRSVYLLTTKPRRPTERRWFLFFSAFPKILSSIIQRTTRTGVTGSEAGDKQRPKRNHARLSGQKMEWIRVMNRV